MSIMQSALNAECHRLFLKGAIYAECHFYRVPHVAIVMPIAIILNVVFLNVMAPNFLEGS
jgi:hypothetical protein